MNKMLYALALAAVSTAASGADIDFSYNFSNATPSGWGTGKAETYDVAVRLDNPSFEGAKVKGIRVAIPSEGTTDASAWLTGELKLKKKNGKNVNDPGIDSKSGTIADGMLEISFDTPYTIPAGGCYVGYSFTVSDVNSSTEAPVSTVDGIDPAGLYLHTSRTKLRWGEVSEELGKVSSMTIMLEGNFPERAAYITLSTAQGAVDEEFSTLATVVNGAMEPIESIGYAYKAGDYSGTGTAETIGRIEGRIGATGKALISFDAFGATGNYPVEIRVTSVNGMSADCAATEGTAEIYLFMPVNRPLVEEYTGLWCGWCPRGYMALEMMKKLKGDRFIAATYHNNDPMSWDGNTPNYVSGYPGAYINRSTSVNLKDIFTDWDNFRNFIPEGEVEVKVEWTDDSHNAIRATSTTRFIKDHTGADYRVSYLLIADNLSSPDWKQTNYFSGKTIEEYPYMDNEIGRMFLEGGAKMQGLVFNDVAIAGTDFDGFAGSIPAEIVAGESYSHSYIFSLEGISKDVLTQPDYLRVIAVICDARTGKFLNSNSSAYTSGEPFVDMSGVQTVKTSGEAVEIARYTLDGRLLNAPAPGINIIRYSDGSTRKVMVKR